MSFCLDTKKALCAVSKDKNIQDCCDTALFHGLVLGARVYTDKEFRFASECEAVCGLLIKLFLKHIGTAPEEKTVSQAGKKLYVLESNSKELLSALHGALDLFSEPYRVNDAIIYECDKCSSFFLRGLFLSRGQLSDPAKGLRLELPMRGESLASDVEGLLCMMSLPPCKTTRRNNPLLYYRKSALVENFLAFIGAGSSVLTIIEEKIVRELRNDTNRQNNLENAMLKRAVSAAVEQISVIKELNKRGLLETLPEDLKVTASLRLLYESATLEQLGAKHMPPISKSGVKHRLEKIKDFYEKYKK